MRFLILLCLVAGTAPSCDGGKSSDNTTARQRAWKNSLDHQRFQFFPRETGVIYSLSQFRGDCQIAMVYDPAKWWQLTFHLQRAGKDLATVVGSTASVFVGKKGTFYFAQFSTGDCGCRVIAFDTSTGRKLWEKQLQAAGVIQHSAYSNHVTMRLAPDTPSGPAATAPSEWHSLIVTGSEGAGNYVEVLDTETGAELAHRVFR
jgi:outer membrane protein assembly factor BamB